MKKSATKQCQGTTLKGIQCKRRIKESNSSAYCRDHTGQDNSKPKQDKHNAEQEKSVIAKPMHAEDAHTKGFLYLFTYLELYENSLVERNARKSVSWLLTDNSKLHKTTNEKNEPWKHKENAILIKVGMTTRNDVRTRISEWERQCQHKVVVLTPPMVAKWNKNKLSKEQSARVAQANALKKLLLRFKKRPVNNPPTVSASAVHTAPHEYNCFAVDGFECYNPGHVEAIVHQWLWDTFGKANIICTGCNKSHREWVLIQTHEINKLLRKIDQVCSASFKQGSTLSQGSPSIAPTASRARVAAAVPAGTTNSRIETHCIKSVPLVPRSKATAVY